MVNELKDIVIKIKPDLETKQFAKDLQYMVNTSKNSMEKAYRSLDKSVSLAIHDAVKDTSKVEFGGEWQKSIDDMIYKFREMQDYMQETGLLPKGVNTGLYQAYANIVKMNDAYQKAVQEAIKLNQALQNLPEDKFVKIRQDVTEAALKVNKYEKELDSVEQKMETLGRLEALPKVPENIVKRYDTITAKIEKLKQQSEQLYKQAYSQPKTSAALVHLLIQREAIEKQIVNQERALRTIGSENLRIIQQMRDLAGQLSFKPSEKSMEDLHKEADVLVNKLDKAKEKWQDLMSQQDTLTSTKRTTSDNFEAALTNVKDLESQLVVSAQKVNELNIGAKKTGNSFNQWRVAAFSVFRVLGSISAVGSDIVRTVRRIANFYMRVWKAAKKVLSVFKNMGKAIRGTADEHAKSFKQMIKDIFRYSLGIRSLFMLFRRLRTYIKEAFTEMANQIPAVNAMLASLKSSLYGLKGSLATAFEPILSAIAPALVRLIDLLAQAITYIGMFFAALTGRGFVYQAKKVAQTIGDAAGSAKELNKQLQGFDELNNLTTNQGGGGGGGDTPLAQFEKIDVPDWIKNLTDKIKKLWDDIMGPIRDAWAKIGDYVIAAWKRAFNSVKDLLMDIVRDFVKAWKSGLGEAIATNFFKIIGDIGNIIANIADKLREAWNYNENGYKIWVAILNIVNVILAGIQRITEDIKEWTKEINITPAMTAFREWLESLVPVVQMIMDILYDIYHDALKPILNWAFDGENSGIAVFFRILTKFNDSLNKSKIKQNLDKIWRAVGRFGATIGKGLLIFMDRMLGYLADWLNSDDFTQWCKDVAEFLDNIHPEDIADDLEQVVRIIKNIAEEVWKAIKFVIDHKDTILDFLEKVSEHLGLIAGLFVGGKLITDLGRLALNVGVAVGSISQLFGAGGIAAGTRFVTGAGEVITASSTGNGALAAAGSAAGTGIFLRFAAGVAAAIAGYNIGNKGAIWLSKVLGEEDDVELYQRYSGLSGFLDLCKETVSTFVERTGEHFHNFEDSVNSAFETNSTDEFNNKIGTISKNVVELTGEVNTATNNMIPPAEGVMKVYDSVGTTIKGVKSASDEYADRIIDLNTEVEIAMGKHGKYKTTLDVIEEAQRNNVKIVDEGKTAYERITDELGNVTIKLQDTKPAYQKAGEAAKDAGDNVANYVAKSDDVIKIIPLANQELEGTINVYDTAGSKAEELSGHTINIKNATGEVIEVIPNFNSSLGDAQTAMSDTSETAKETGGNIVAGIKEPMENATFGETVAAFFKNLWTSITETFGIGSPAKTMYPIGNFILEGIVEGFKEKFEEWSKTIKEFYEGTVKPWFDPSKWTFEGVGQGLKETFEEAKDLIKTPINGILGFIEKLVNGIVDGFNKMGETLGGLDIDVPDWVPEIGGKKFELRIPKLNHVTIPRLAQGAVIPPNNEFLAVLGDQKRGTNIESPLSTMVEAFNMANRGGNEQELALLQEQNSLLRQLLDKEFGISENDIYRSVRNQDRTFYNSTGRSGFAY